MIEVPTVRRRLLGAELRRLRESAGFSLDDAAQILECDRSKISRIETGHRGMRPKELRELLAEYGVAENRRYALADLARQAGKRGWWQDHGGILPVPYQDFISLEASAAAQWTYETHVVPGLLQTEDYARAVAAAGPATEAARDHDRHAAVRRSRQQVLTRADDPLRYLAVLSEAVLRQMVGGPGVMRAQLDRLLEVNAALPNVTVRVLPFAVGARAAGAGAFALLMFPEPTELGVVYLDSLTGGLFLEDPKDVRRHASVHEHLRASALPADESAALIEKAAGALPRV
jgi:transcriptional regulator with XRE-family HTH domain